MQPSRKFTFIKFLIVLVIFCAVLILAAVLYKQYQGKTQVSKKEATRTTVATNQTPTPTSSVIVKTAVFSLEASPSTKIRTEFPVVVKVSSDTDTVNLLSAHISFPSDKLTVFKMDKTGSFATQWVEEFYDNKSGRISITGGIPSPGYKTSGIPQTYYTIYFTSKQAGPVTLTFVPDTLVYRNSDSANILKSTSPVAITITP